MRYLLDTNAFSDLMRKHPQLDARLAALAPVDNVVICPIVRGEIRFGIEALPQSRRREALEAQCAPLFAAIACEPIPERAGDHYATTKFARQQQGLTLDENDPWIAATALALDAVLVTRDNDFKNIPALRVENWAG